MTYPSQAKLPELLLKPNLYTSPITRNAPCVRASIKSRPTKHAKHKNVTKLPQATGYVYRAPAWAHFSETDFVHVSGMHCIDFWHTHECSQYRSGKI
jgi:hypothetical protein